MQMSGLEANPTTRCKYLIRFRKIVFHHPH